MKKLKALMMTLLLLFCVAAFWGCQQGNEDVVPDGTTADVTVDAGDPMGEDGDEDEDDEDDEDEDDDDDDG